MNITEYKVIEHSSLSEFSRLVNEEIQNGWQPHGNIVTEMLNEEYDSVAFYTQVIVRFQAPPPPQLFTEAVAQIQETERQKVFEAMSPYCKRLKNGQCVHNRMLWPCNSKVCPSLRRLED